MRKSLTTILCGVFMMLLTCPGICQQIHLGQTWLNQTLDGERGPNILATDFQFQLDRPDAGASYHARLHDDKLIWQRIEAGPKWKNLQAFYSLDLINGSALSGGGVMVNQRLPSSQISLIGGVYDRGFCAEATCSVERNGFVGRIGYEFRKIQDTRWWGPSVSVGWRW